MVKRWVLVRYVWDRSGALVPALLVGLTADALAVIVVLPAIWLIVHAARSSAAGATSNLAVLVPTLFAAMLSAMVAGLLASFNLLRAGLERLEEDKLTVLARVEQLRDGVPLCAAEKYQTVAILCRRQWCSRQDARDLVDGFADERLMSYLLDNLAPRSSRPGRAVEQLREERLFVTRDSSDWSIPRP